MLWTPETRHVVFDLETLGLDPDVHPIVEVGIRIVDLNLRTLDMQTWFCWSGLHSKIWSELETIKDDWVFGQHTKSGLHDEAVENGDPIHVVEGYICDFLEHHEIGKNDPMMGSSVHFDRAMLAAQMPRVIKTISYRNEDVSSIKESCRRYNPVMFAHLDEDVKPKQLHRVQPDIDDTLAEYKWYLDNYLMVDGRVLDD